MNHGWIATLGLCLVAAVGCGHDGGHAAAHAEPEAEHLADGSHDGHAPVELELTLDDGKKWQVDDHTRASAAKMIELVHGTAPFAAVDDARAMREALNTELQALIAGCTMEGAAHDELHVILAALFPRLNVLDEENDLEILDATRIEIASVFDAYQQHFE